MKKDKLADAVFSRLAATSGVEGCDDHFAIDKWEWPQGVALYGLYRRCRSSGAIGASSAIGAASAIGVAGAAGTATGPADDLGFLVSWFERRLAAGLPPRNVNTTAPLLALVSLLEIEPRPEWRALCLDWAEWVMHGMPRTPEGGIQHVTSHLFNPGELWADTLFMTVLFLARAGVAFGREDMVEEASYQFLLHIRYLSDAEAGLWFHGWTFEGRHHYGRVHWARGNAWFCLAAVEFLEMARPEGAAGRTIEEAFRCLMSGLSRLQADDGLWHTILDDPSSYTETSASAAIAYAALKGLRLGLLGPGFKDLAARAEAGVRARIDDAGVVGGVSHGTALGMDAAHYLAIPVSPTAYGQGLAFLMLGEAEGGEAPRTGSAKEAD